MEEQKYLIAIGGYLACSLKKTSADVSIIARGEHKHAIEQKGLKLIKENDQETHEFNVTDSPIELPVQDFVFLSVKGSFHSVGSKNGVLLGFCVGIPCVTFACWKMFMDDWRNEDEE